MNITSSVDSCIKRSITKWSKSYLTCFTTSSFKNPITIITKRPSMDVRQAMPTLSSPATRVTSARQFLVASKVFNMVRHLALPIRKKICLKTDKDVSTEM